MTLSVWFGNIPPMERRSIPSKLSAKSVESAKPKLKPYKLSDGGGLFLLVNPNGSRYWRLKYRFENKEKTLSLGVYHGGNKGVSLLEARQKALAAKDLLKQGVDPSLQKKADKLSSNTGRFSGVAREWWLKEKDRWTEDHASRVMSSLEKEVFPIIGDMPMSKITSRHCLLVVRSIEERGALDVASRVKQRMSAVFRYGVYTGYNDNNPVDALKDVIKSRKVTHRKALPAKSLPAFLNALDEAENITPVTKIALKFLMLTFVRPGELRGARWEEVDINEREWRLPPERMKMKEEHIVPLVSRSIELLEELRPITGMSEYIFPGYHDPKKCMSENTLTFAIKKRLGFDATAHGFRTVASTILNEAGFRPDVIERQLAHAERNKVRAAYNKAQYLAERREMMQWWSDFLESMDGKGRVALFNTKNGSL